MGGAGRNQMISRRTMMFCASQIELKEKLDIVGEIKGKTDVIDVTGESRMLYSAAGMCL